MTAAGPMSAPLNLTATRSKTALFDIAVLESDGTTPQDLTSATLYFHASVGGVTFSKSSLASGGITITSPTGGLAELQINPADTAAILGSGYGTCVGPCELTMVDASGDAFELSQGTILVNTNVGTP